MSGDRPADRLTDLEIASGLVLGADGPAVDPDGGRGVGPVEALERALLPALTRAPCVIGFSGGRDSSALLAVATRLAERQGLEPPVALSLRYPSAPSAQESSWQELVISDLGISDWLQVDVTDVDLVSQRMTAFLERYGVVWPPNAVLTAIAIARAPGGSSFVSGLGGDQLFGQWRWRSLADGLSRRRRIAPYDALRLGYVALPGRVRARREGRRLHHGLIGQWLRPGAASELRLLAARELAEEPVWWRDRVRWRSRGRDLRLWLSTLRRISATRSIEAFAPLVEPGFVAALGEAGGPLGYGDRTATMEAIFAGVLPDEVLRRETKAIGHELFWQGGPQAFATDWDGSGVDHDLVDPEALRTEWRKPRPSDSSALLFQSAWLHSRRHAAGATAG